MDHYCESYGVFYCHAVIRTTGQQIIKKLLCPLIIETR